MRRRNISTLKSGTGGGSLLPSVGEKAGSAAFNTARSFFNKKLKGNMTPVDYDQIYAFGPNDDPIKSLVDSTMTDCKEARTTPRDLSTQEGITTANLHASVF